MEFSAALVADLGVLTEALDGPDLDIAETLRCVAQDAQLAVPSIIGLSVVIGIGLRQLTLTAFEQPNGSQDILTSLRVPLPLGRRSLSAEARSNAEIALVLYASTPGAFVDLAADLLWLDTKTLPGLERITLDRHLFALSAGPELSVRQLSVVNQAVGVLIGRGHTPEEAERALFLDAVRAGVDLTASAATVLEQIEARPDEAAEV